MNTTDKISRRECGCPARGVVAVDEQAHAAWHARVLEQTGRPGPPTDQRSKLR